MRSTVDTFVDRFQRDRRNRLRLTGIILLLAVVVVFTVFWGLHNAGVAMTNEVYCGMEEHQHDDSCYTWELTCGLEESGGTAGHTHDSGCYEAKSVLVCGLEETEGHTHDKSCYDADGNLICGIPESEGHRHSEDCYETTRVLICGLEKTPASAGHTHTASCYTRVLTCDIPEHVHTMACMIDETADLESAEDWEATLPEEEDFTGVWNEDIVLIAESQIGYTESEANFRLADDNTRNGYTRYGAWYGNKYGTWDAMFAAFCLYYAGVTEDYMPYNSGAFAWIAELTDLAEEGELDQPIYVSAEEYIPDAGDLVFLDTDEDDKADTVAIFAGIDGETGDFLLIQGDRHDAVEEYAIAAEDESILGYGVIPSQDDENETTTTNTVSGSLDGEQADPAGQTEDTSYDAEDDASGEAEAGSASEELASEDSDIVIYTAEDGGISVSVAVPAGALPEGAELALTLYEEDSPEYIQALARMEEANADDGASESYEVSAEDSQATVLSVSSPEEEDEDEEDAPEAEEESSFSFSFGSEEDIESCLAAMDISFLLDGEEVEPSAPAEVTMDASEFLDGQDVLSLEVWHIEESEDGTEPVLVAEVSDADEAELGVVEFTVESFSEFEFHYDCSAGGFAGFGVNLLYENGDTISATVSSDYSLTGSRYTYPDKVDMPYTIDLEKFINEVFDMNGTYTFLYATVTDPNYGDTEHNFDVWPGEEKVGANELYGSEENPVVSITIDGTAATENPNYNSQNVVSKTWHFTLTYEDGTSVTIPIYGNADGANDNGGKYCPKYLEINLYFEKDPEVVLNLGNGNGTNSDGDYTGSKDSGGNALRYGTGGISAYADEDGKVTINLPSDNDLDAEFTVVNAVGTEGEDGYLPAVTVELGKEQAYDYKLIGWINIATGDYYDVSNGPATATVDLSNDNVFYADWIAANYDQGHSTDENLRDDTVSTADFVTIQMFDYNELFDLYSLTLEQNGTDSEEWTDSENLYSEPLLGNDPSELIRIGNSFIFQNNGTTVNAQHVISHANPVRWNLWTKNPNWTDYPEYDFVLDAEEYWDITSPSSTILGMLYDTDETSLGVHYVGDADYLFWIDDGYYTYDSAVSGAAYNQSDGQFYVYTDNKNAFFPYNGHGDSRTSDNGLTNYWFGMYMKVEFYLPTSTSKGTEDNKVNQVDGKDMVFDFSGDDDIMVFIDGELVVDMSGIHGTSYSRINFSTNTVTYSMGLDSEGAPNITSDNVKHSESELNLSSGNHTMEVFYMERGASESNLKVQFNIMPAWGYESGPVQTVTAKKVWMNSSGNVIDDTENLKEEYKIDIDGVEVGLFDKLGESSEKTAESDAVFGYTRNGSTYTVEYTDDNGAYHKYVYDASAPSLTYTKNNESPAVYTDIDSEDRVLDNNGYIIAWMDGDYLYIRVDEQTLNEGNEWSYNWELLEPDGDYEVLELTSGVRYTATSTNEDLTSYEYWSVIGDREIEESFDDEDAEPLQVILTEAAQEATDSLGDTGEAMGWVIVAAENGVTSEQVKFNQIAELEERTTASGISHYYSICGVTTRNEIESLGSGAVWYVEDTGEVYEDMNGEAEGFYLYCVLGEQKYYLALNEEQNGLVATNESAASVFFYDSLGELMVEVGENNSVRVEFQDGTIHIGEAKDSAALYDVRIYSLKETETTGFAFTASNIILPDILLQKTDAVTGQLLSGVGFTLQEYDTSEGDVEPADRAGLYYSVDPNTGDPVWISEKSIQTTGDIQAGGDDGIVYQGAIQFEALADGTYLLTEVSSPNGYNNLPSSIVITIKNGAITETEWLDNDTQDNFPIDQYVTTSDGGLTITIRNMPGVSLPNTGSGNVLRFILAGLGAVVIAGGVLAYRGATTAGRRKSRVRAR